MRVVPPSYGRSWPDNTGLFFSANSGQLSLVAFCLAFACEVRRKFICELFAERTDWRRTHIVRPYDERAAGIGAPKRKIFSCQFLAINLYVSAQGGRGSRERDCAEIGCKGARLALL
jgi:hypothetical protein